MINSLGDSIFRLRQEERHGQSFCCDVVAEELAQIQRQWIGLQSIYGSVEALEQLPDDAEAFEQVDGFWRAYLRRIRGEQSNAITVVEEEGLYELPADKNGILAAVQRKLEVTPKPL